MNNLCCVLDSQVTCYFCRILWCQGCWDKVWADGSLPTLCTSGSWPSIGKLGHYYMTVDKINNVQFSLQSELERFRIMPVAATAEKAV